MSAPVSPSTNRILAARRGAWVSGRCQEFADWFLPRVSWDTLPRECCYDAYVAWASARRIDPIGPTAFSGALDWAANTGRLGDWGPCKRKGPGVPTRYMDDVEVFDELGLSQWQPSHGFTPKSLYLGIGR